MNALSATISNIYMCFGIFLFIQNNLYLKEYNINLVLVEKHVA